MVAYLLVTQEGAGSTPVVGATKIKENSVPEV